MNDPTFQVVNEIKITEVILRVRKEVEKTLNQIYVYLKKFHLNEEAFEDTLKRIETSEIEFIRKIMNLKEVKQEGDVVRSYLERYLKKKIYPDDVLKRAKQNLKYHSLRKSQERLLLSKLNEFIKIKERNANILNKIGKSVEIKETYSKLQRYWDLEKFLGKYTNWDYIEGLNRINFVFKDEFNKILDDLIPLVNKIAEKEKLSILLKLPNNIDIVQNYIERYEKYISYPTSDDLGVLSIYNKCLLDLHAKINPEIRAKLLIITKYKKTNKNWLDSYQLVLDKYRELSKGKYFIDEERKTIKEIIAKLRKDARRYEIGEKSKSRPTEREGGGMWRGVKIRCEEILTIIVKYPKYIFRNQREEAENTLREVKNKIG